MAIVSQYEIDGDQALATLQKLQGSFLAYNSALGQVTQQQASFNEKGGAALLTFTQINNIGQRTKTTFQQVKDANGQLTDSYKILATQIGAASNAQRKHAELLVNEAALANKLADRIAGPQGPTTASPITSGIKSVDPRLIAQEAAAFASISKAQVEATITARGLNTAQAKTFRDIVDNSATVKQAFTQLNSGVDFFKNKLEQAGSIAFATIIYRGISLITQGLQQGISTAIDYTHQIGLIQTISQDSGESFDSWNKSIRGVANELGRPVAEVAKDTYDALSNQVIKTSADFDLLRTAITLEQNTGSQSGTGLNTLSSLINGLGVGSLQAQTLADKLFVTIDKGRVRLDEINNVIGRTISLGQQAGASFDETAAALAVLTQSGIKADEATTLLNNIYAEGIKPNEALSKALQQLNVDTFQEGVQAFGLTKLLGSLGDQAKKTSNGLATFFPDIRGLRGASTLFTQLESFQSSLKAIQGASGSNALAKGILDANAGEQLIREGNRIKNFFTTDLGVGLVETFAKITQSVGGFDKVLRQLTPVIVSVGAAIAIAFSVTAISSFITILGTLSKAYFLLTTRIGASAAAQLAFNQTVAAGTANLGVFAAIATATYIASTIAAEAFTAAQIEATNSISKPFRTFADRENADNKVAASKRVEVFANSVAKMATEYSRFISKAKDLNEDLGNSAKKNFDAATKTLQNASVILLTYLRKNVSDLESAQDKSLDNIKKSQESASDVIIKSKEREHDRQVELIKENFEQQKSAIDKYNQDVAAQGGTNFRTANPQNAIDALTKIKNATIAAATSQANLAAKKGDLDETEKAYEKITKALDDYKSNLDDIGVRVNIGKEDQAQAVAQQQRILNSIQAQKQANAELFGQYNKQREVVEDVADILQRAQKFQAEVFDKKGKITDDFAGDPDRALKVIDELKTKLLDLQKSVDLGKNPLVAGRITESFADASKAIDIQRNALAGQLAAAKNEIASAAGLAAQQEQGQKIKQIYENIEIAILKATTAANNSVASVKANAASLDNLTQAGFQNQFSINNPIESLKGAFQANSNADTTGLRQQASDLQVLVSATNKDIPAIQAKFKELEASAKAINLNRIFDVSDPTKLITVEEVVKNIASSISNLKESQNSLGGLTTQLGAFTQGVNALETNRLKDTRDFIQGIANSAGGLTASAGGVEALATANAALAAQYEREATALERIKAAGGTFAIPANVDGGSAEGHAAGGIVGSRGGFLSDFLNGKFASGTDIIPTMLTRDEFVVRAPMARKFFSQLTAINSNQEPIYRADGGSVSNTSTNNHNYNIHVAGGDNPAQLAKTVITHIRRAQRQGTIR